MPYKIVKFLSAFIPSKRLRWSFRNRCTILRLGKDNEISISRADAGKCRLSIAGNGNIVRVGRLPDGGGMLDIRIFGSGNKIIIGEGIHVAQDLRIVVGQDHPNFGPVSGCQVTIGRMCSFESCSMTTYNSGATIEIGDECMFSFGVVLYNTDGHPIFDKDSGAIVNRVKALHIGNHVWVGARVVVLKNSYVADDCILGFGSVVSGRFVTANSVIAGNPAVARKQTGSGVLWLNGDPDYIQNGYEGDGAHADEATEGCLWPSR